MTSPAWRKIDGSFVKVVGFVVTGRGRGSEKQGKLCDVIRTRALNRPW